MTSSVQPSPRIKASHFDEDNLRQHPPSRKESNARVTRQQPNSSSPTRQQSVINSLTRQQSISNDAARRASNQRPPLRKASNQSPVRQESMATRRESTVYQGAGDQSRKESRYRRESRKDSIWRRSASPVENKNSVEFNVRFGV